MQKTVLLKRFCLKEKSSLLWSQINWIPAIQLTQVSFLHMDPEPITMECKLPYWIGLLYSPAIWAAFEEYLDHHSILNCSHQCVVGCGCYRLIGPFCFSFPLPSILSHAVLIFFIKMSIYQAELISTRDWIKLVPKSFKICTNWVLKRCLK